MVVRRWGRKGDKCSPTQKFENADVICCVQTKPWNSVLALTSFEIILKHRKKYTKCLVCTLNAPKIVNFSQFRGFCPPWKCSAGAGLNSKALQLCILIERRDVICQTRSSNQRPHVAKAGHNKHTVCLSDCLAFQSSRRQSQTTVEKACTVQDLSNFANKTNFNKLFRVYGE